MQRQIEALRAKRLLLGQLHDYILAARKSDSWTDHNALMMKEAMDKATFQLKEFLKVNPDLEIERILEYLDLAKSDKALLANPNLHSRVIRPLENLLHRTEREKKRTEEKIARFKEQTKGESAKTKSSALRQTLKIGSIVSVAGLTYYLFTRRKNGKTDKH